MADEIKTPGHAALRRGRRSIAGQIYLLTTTTHRRTPIFHDASLAAVVATFCNDAQFWSDSKLLCWVLMPDHWHGILELGAQVSVSERMRKFKGASACAINRMRSSNASVWSAGFHDHALRFEEDLIGVSRYAAANPQRAGLVARAEEYPYWNAVWGRDAL